MLLSSRFSRTFPLLVVGALVISALAAGPALAHKGGRARSTADPGQCWVTPNPVSNDVAGYYTVNGSGFAPYSGVNVFVMSPSQTEIQILTPAVDGDGTFVASDWAPFLIEDGAWTVSIFQSGDMHLTLLATCAFEVN